jgi:hypothetical protein
MVSIVKKHTLRAPILNQSTKFHQNQRKEIQTWGLFGMQNRLLEWNVYSRGIAILLFGCLPFLGIGITLKREEE